MGSICYCHYDRSGVNTNVEKYMIVYCTKVMLKLPYETFQNKLKNNLLYMDHKPNRRLDDLTVWV